MSLVSECREETRREDEHVIEQIHFHKGAEQIECPKAHGQQFAVCHPISVRGDQLPRSSQAGETATSLACEGTTLYLYFAAETVLDLQYFVESRRSRNILVDEVGN